MSQTANYGLYITADSTEHFYDWRNKMNGIEDSNMIKIDAALGDKADRSSAVYAFLLASDWDSSNQQVLKIDGLRASHNGTISIAPAASAAQREAARLAALSVVSQGDGELTIAADGTVPAMAIPVCIILLG